MISRADAFEIVIDSVKRLPARSLPVDKALGCVLARDLSSPIDLPPFDCSAMDGYAVAAGERSLELRVTGEVAAGKAYRGTVKPGCAVRIMTGAMLPSGADRVVVKENVVQAGVDRIRISADDRSANVRRRGEDVKRGEILHFAGERIAPLVAADVAAAGLSRVPVYLKPRVGILVTGGELVEPGRRRRAGTIYDSNGPMLLSMLASMGIEVSGRMNAADSPGEISGALAGLLSRSDAVFVTGGVSVGEHDLVAASLEAAGCRIRFDRVAVQPGKPFTFATRGAKPVFAFPGNPVSAFVSCFLFAVPALRRMMGMEHRHGTSKKRFSGSFERMASDRELFLPVRFAGMDLVEAVPWNSSAHIHALCAAEGLAAIPPGVSKLKDGDCVETIRLPAPL